MNEPMKGPSSYVVVAGIGFDETTFAVARAAARAAAKEASGELHLVHVAPPPMIPPPPLAPAEPATEAVIANVRERLRSLSADLEIPPTVKVTMHGAIGRPADEIVALAQRLGASLVVVGTHGRRGVRRVMLGSVAEEVMRASPCEVLTVRPLPVSRWTRRLQRRAMARVAT